MSRPVAEKTFTHSHPSCSSDILYQLPPSTTIYSILLVQFTCLTVLFHYFSPGPLWSSLGLKPSTTYSIHFFTKSSSSFRNTMSIPSQPLCTAYFSHARDQSTSQYRHYIGICVDYLRAKRNERRALPRRCICR